MDKLDINITNPSQTSGMADYNVTDMITSSSSTDVTNQNMTSLPSGSDVINSGAKERITVLVIIMALTVIGNVTLILVLLCKRSRRIKRVNILLVNLAFGDIAVALFVNSVEILFLAFGDWALGPVVCKISVYVQMICLSSTTNLLTAMSIDRYQVIVKPMQSLARRPRIWLKIAVAWILSLLFPIPQLFIFVQVTKGVKADGSPLRSCSSEGYTAKWQRKVYFLFTISYILIVPMTIMLYCYVKIIRVIWSRSNNEPTYSSPPASQKARGRQENSPSGGGRGRGGGGGGGCGRGGGGGGGGGGKRRPCINSNTSSPPTITYTSADGVDGIDLDLHQPNRLQSEAKAGRHSVHWAKTFSSDIEDSDTSCSMESALNPCNDDVAAARSKTRASQKSALSTDSVYSDASPRMCARRGLVTGTRRRVIILTLTVVLSFLLCHLPYFLVHLLRIFSDYHLKLKALKAVSENFVLVHSTLNPLLYGLFTLRKRHLVKLMHCLLCRPSLETGTKKGSQNKNAKFGGDNVEEKHRLLSSFRSHLCGHKKHGGRSSKAKHASRSSKTSLGGVSGSSNQNFRNRKRDKNSRKRSLLSSFRRAAPPPSSTSASATTAAGATAASLNHSSPSLTLRSFPTPSAFFAKFRSTNNNRKPSKDNQNLLFTNADAIQMVEKGVLKHDDTECSELDSSSSPQGTMELPSLTAVSNTNNVTVISNINSVSVVTNTNSVMPVSNTNSVSKNNVFVYQDPNVYDTNTSLRMKSITKEPEEVKSSWPPNEGEFMLGGLARV